MDLPVGENCELQKQVKQLHICYFMFLTLDDYTVVSYFVCVDVEPTSLVLCLFYADIDNTENSSCG